MKRQINAIEAARAALVLQFMICGVMGGYSQGLNNLWTGGYASWAGPPFGGVDIDFQGGNMSLTYVSRDMEYDRTTANISSPSGALLFSTNGVRVADASGNTMFNGDGLNPGDYADANPVGLLIVQGALILPSPDNPDLYLLFHMTIDDVVTLRCERLSLTTIDMSLQGGLGGVVSKNQPILVDDLNVGRLTAVRHANGRDWWVFCHKTDTNIFYRLLVTPAGVSIDGTQAIGSLRPPENGQACFSPDGSKFAYYWGESDLDIFDFDRCTGLFSDSVFVPIDDYDGEGGVAFSPNGRFLYVSSILDAYQFDTEASDIAASMVHIAHWDSTYSPSPPFATLFDIAQLAPDGKIYISTANGTDKLHVIHAPDSAGLACDMEQHGIQLPVYFLNSLPNHPNYHLGPIDGSVCDSLGINVQVVEEALRLGVQAYPNPNTGSFTLCYAAQPTVGELEVRDLSGRIVLRERVPQWSSLHEVDLRSSAAGMYQCTLHWGQRSANVRIIIQP